MVKIKKLHLERYCGYTNTDFNFTKDGNIKQFSAFFGPNGCGKSNLLNAVHLLCIAKRIKAMEKTDLLFRKLTFHKDYNPTYIGFIKSEKPMLVEGIFETDEGEKEVVLHSEKGVVKDELPYNPYGHVYYIDADNPINMSKFQLHKKYADLFLEIARIVYGFNCYLENEVDALGESIDDPRTTGEFFYTDFIIEKKWTNTKVHFKRMSAGEKKIAILIRDLCNPDYIENIDIINIDNIFMHIYFKRHAMMLDKLMDEFKDKQFLFTTHSGIALEYIQRKYGPEYLYDIEDYKKKSYIELSSENRNRRTRRRA